MKLAISKASGIIKPAGGGEEEGKLIEKIQFFFPPFFFAQFLFFAKAN